MKIILLIVIKNCRKELKTLLTTLIFTKEWDPMAPNVIKTIFLFSAAFAACSVGYGQTKMVKNSKAGRFSDQVSHKYSDQGIPETELCSDYSTVIFHFRRNKMLDSIDFTRNPKLIKSAMAIVIPDYRRANWKLILPTSAPNFDLVQQVYYRYANHSLCADTLTDDRIEQMKIEDLNSRKDNLIPTYILKIIKIVKWEAVN